MGREATRASTWIRNHRARRGLRPSALFLPLLALASFCLAAERVAVTVDSLALKASVAEGESPPDGIRYYPRSGYVWPYAAGPFYGNVDRGQRARGVLVTAVGAFRLDGRALPFPDELTAPNRLDREASQYFLVQVDPDSVNRERWDRLYAKIRAGGGEVIRHMPVAVVLARLTPQAHAALRGTRDLLAIEPYHPAFKLDPEIGRTPLLDPQKALSDVYTLDISLHRGEDPADVVADIARMGGNVLSAWSDRIQAELPSARLAELAGLEAVYKVHEKTPIVPWDQKITNAVQTGGINFNANPYHDAGIRGAGQVLMVLDNGIQMDAGDLSDTPTSAGTAGPAHRKVRFYGTTAPFGGSGDDGGCDAPEQGGFTHGHLVSAIALGNPEHADITYRALEVDGTPWDLTGVAPDARLAAYDANLTPAIGACQDTLLGVLDVGELYDPSPTAEGSLDDAYQSYGARTFNFSWGSNNNSYTANADDVDEFLNDHKNAMVFTAVGNRGRDYNNDVIPDLGSIGEPATAKNAVAIGSHGGPDDLGNPANINERSYFSGVGPAGATGRFAPVLMAPGEERGATGKSIAFSCRSTDNDSVGAVVCDPVSSKAGTSFASAAAAGAGLLVRDYFAQGFHPDGTSTNPGNTADEVPDVSGALVKSTLIASAEFLGLSFSGATPYGFDNVTARSRANNEQGYGRIQLDNALPLQNWAGSATGLLVVDGGIPGGVTDFAGSDLTGTIDATATTTQTATFELCDDSQKLRLALSWVEEPGDGLVNDLDLEVLAPDGTLYFGNFFTDDDNNDGVIDPSNEDCPSRFDDGTPLDNGLDRSQWSLAVCSRPGDGVNPGGLPLQDAINPTAGIFLSPNPEGNLDEDGVPILRGGTCDNAATEACGYDAHCDGAACLGGTSQVQAGTWTVRVKTKGAGSNDAQGYALVIAGGVCSGSSVTLDRTIYTCDDDVTLVVNERDEASDPAGGLDAGIVAARTRVEVLGTDGRVRDLESGSDLGLTPQAPGSLRFAGRLSTTDGTSYDPGNGVLDVRHGDTLRLIYADESVGGVDGDPNKVRVATAGVDCRLQILSSSVRFAQFGTNASFLVTGGCERNARGLFEFGFPDRYMDAGEALAYRIAWASVEAEPLGYTVVELSCVFADADSPADCRPGSADCPDPERLNNPPCTDLIILDPMQVMGQVDATSAISSNFQIQMNPVITGTPEVEMLLSISGAQSGKTTRSLVVNRHRLNVDEATVRYSTDFPHGGTLTIDRNNNGLIENPVTTGITGFPTSTNTDYVFETVQYSDLTQGIDAAGNPVVINDGIQAPWNFDNNDGGFTTGLAAGTDDSLIPETIALWGEDKNFNNVLDGRCAIKPSQSCDRFPYDPINCIFCVGGSNAGEQCNTDIGCPGGTCAITEDSTCINLEDRDPANFPVRMLDQNWSARGGCGWQTRAPGTCSDNALVGCYNDGDCGTFGSCTGPAQATGGIWHTGRIGDDNELACVNTSVPVNTCQMYETIGGVSGQLTWFELLVTPELTKVNQAVDEFGRPLATAEITEWRWNQAVDLADRHASYTLEFDHDVESLEPVDLKSDFTVLTTLAGAYGAINGRGNPFHTRGWGLFAPLDPATGMTRNGTVGNNRAGKNSCIFEGGAVPVPNLEFVGLPGPPDDDTNEGYCPSGSGSFGMDAHLKYCTTVCSENSMLPCGADAACAGTCIGGLSGYCSNMPLVYCRATCSGGDNDGNLCSNDADCRTCQGGFNDGTSCTLDTDCMNGEDDGFCGSPGTCPTNVDDQCDFGACVDTACNGVCADGACSNGKTGTCTSDFDCEEACVFTSAAIDEFVQPNGPVRNHELNDLNGPDMRYQTLGDLFGVAGNRFAGAIGFQVREANYSPAAIGGYGLGIDDMVVEWREFTLEEDRSNCVPHCVGGAADGLPCSADADCASGGGTCSGGSCATLNLSSNNIYEGDTVLGITVVDLSPSDNDCDGDGITDGTRDCDGNRIPDVVVQLDSPESGASSDVERAILNAIPGSATAFKGSVPISTRFDLPGTLFVSPRFYSSQILSGTDFSPTVRASYKDLEDGTGRPCRNSVDADSRGFVRAEANVLITPAPVVVVRNWITDNGDGDGWADPGETVSLAVEVSNKSEIRVSSRNGFSTVSGFDARDVTLRLMSDDPAVACITRSTIALGDLAAGETRVADATFEFIVDSGVQRADALEDLTATLQISIQANEFQVTQQPQTITLDLDLDALGGSGPTTFFEGFEGGFGTFTTMHLDEGLNPPDSDLANRDAGVINADGWRCQYADPGWEGSRSNGNSQGEQCFPNPNGAPDAYYFHVVTDRAFSGTASLGYNIFLDQARGYTTPNSKIDAVRTIDPVNLNWARVCSSSRTLACDDDHDCPLGETCDPAVPLLSFKHQISLLDHRTVGAQWGRGADRAVVSVQLAADDGEGVGPWVKAYPFVNIYDSLANSNYFNCTFDPADDGNTEEDFFDPSDPTRSQGPSSACSPEFSFVHQGDTDGAFSPVALGDALDGPGIEGSHGNGTWVEPVFDLNRYRGRRLRLRFLETGIKLGGTIHWEQAFNFNPDPGDDGWFIDDLTITDALLTPATVLPDENDNGSLPACDARFCGESGGVDVVVTVDPPEGTDAPGQVLELDASLSTVDVCKSGILQFRFWVALDGDATFNPGADLLLRDWTFDPRFRDLPQGTTRYAVSARCATDTDCNDTEIVAGAVTCPSSGNLAGVGHGNAFLHQAQASRRSIYLDGTRVDGDKNVRVHWSTGVTADAIRGDLTTLRADGGFGGNEVCVSDNLAGETSFSDGAPTRFAGDALFWLLRSASACNEPLAGGSYGGVGEAFDRSIDACPD